MNKYITTHMIRMEDLNHHQSLYAGRATDWFMEAAFITITQEYPHPQGILYRNIHSFEFNKPIFPGSIIKLEGMIVRAGKSSITMRVGFYNAINGELHAEGYTTFVTVDSQSKQPVAHGIEMDETDDANELSWRKRAAGFFAK